MIKTNELSNPHSCLNRARVDEPLFVLRANDEHAPCLVRAWAKKYRRAKMLENGAGMTTTQTIKHVRALALADAMEKWRAGQNIKVKPQMTPEQAYATHKTRVSDASSFDEICTLCGATDARGAEGDLLELPCPGLRGHTAKEEGV
jgi:hypothetical protein